MKEDLTLEKLEEAIKEMYLDAPTPDRNVKLIFYGEKSLELFHKAFEEKFEELNSAR